MATLSPTANFLEHLSIIKDPATYAKLVDAWDASKAYLSRFGDGVEPLGDARDVSDLKKRSIPKKSLADTTIRELGSKAVNGAKSAGRATLNLGKNALTGLSNLGETSLGSIGTVAAPAAAGAMWAFMNGIRMDKNGTTKQLADEMNQAFKAGLYVDDEGNYVDADTNEIVGPETAAKRIDAVNNTPIVNNAPVGASEPGMEYPVSEVPSISSIDGGYAEYENPIAPVAAPSAPVLAKNPLADLSDLALADAVIRGKYGNGADRKAALGDRYSAVQALVNQKMTGSTPVAKKAPELADLGNGVVYNPATGKAEFLGTAGDQLRDQVF